MNVDAIHRELTVRNEISRPFFEREARKLAEACRSMSVRFENGGRLLAFGRGSYATDAPHVAVDCMHPPEPLRPVPAISLAAEAANLSAIANDIGG